MPKFTHHVFVCCNQRPAGHPRGCCDADGSGHLRDVFKAELKRAKVAGVVRANAAGCLDQCELGPAVVIYPQAIWYGNVTPADVPRIVAETIVGGRILEDLRIPDDLLNTKGGRVPCESPADPCESPADQVQRADQT
jgi:(2Fe-2S) ferredoxin